MPSGEEEISGNMITFSQVTRHHSGHYICSADNGFGPQPVTAQIKLDVQREYSYRIAPHTGMHHYLAECYVTECANTNMEGILLPGVFGLT